MRHSIKTGLSFGLTSGVITTLGLVVGVHAGTHSRLAVVGAIVMIAVSDAFSDALGIHISEESENRHTAREVWEATVATFVCKFAVAMTFIVPMVWLPLGVAIVASVAWGLALLGLFSWYLAKEQGVRPWKVVGEHLFIALMVVALTRALGGWVAETFG